jgi:hypothetical protein
MKLKSKYYPLFGTTQRHGKYLRRVSVHLVYYEEFQYIQPFSVERPVCSNNKNIIPNPSLGCLVLWLESMLVKTCSLQLRQLFRRLTEIFHLN